MTNKEKSILQKEIVDTIPLCPHGRLLLAPRVGKTKLVIDIIKRGKPKSILWVTPSAKLAKEDIPQEFITWKAKKYVKMLTTVTWKSLDTITGHFDLIVFDEDQHITENNTKNIFNQTLTGKILSMTGTNTKDFDKHNIYKRLHLKTLYKLSINDAVDIGLLSNYTINVVEVELGREKNVKAGRKDNPFMTSEFSNYCYLERTVEMAKIKGDKNIMFKILNRMRAIYNSPTKQSACISVINKLSGRKLIFTGSIKQAESVSDFTYHSKTDNTHLKQFQEGKINSIAMVNSGGTGFTYKAIDHLIITQVDSDNNGNTSQKICRTLLSQKGYHAQVWLLCLNKTQDKVWIESVLENFNKEKINYIKFEDLCKSIKKS